MIYLNHIGIASKDLDSLSRVLSVLGFNRTHVEDVAEQGVRTHFIPLSSSDTSTVGAPKIELLEVLDPVGTVARFLETRGPGVHHLSFEVESGQLDHTCQKLQSAGVQLVYDSPKKGAHGMRVNFIHPKSAGGLLLEVMERGEQ
jgi:methylmalonyl-CoA epimerase